MGSPGAVFCSTAFLLVLLSSASKDENDMEQREVTFDIGKIMQEMQQPDSFVMQKEVDLADLFDPEEFPLEPIRESLPDHSARERENSRQGGLTPRGRRPFLGPRSFGGPPILDYPVQFPLSRPTSENLPSVCLNGDHRPRYPDSYFPASSFSKQKRKASAVNSAEFWFETCCKGNQTWGQEVTLCCATQAWELSVQSFCEEDSSVKDHLYECCKLQGSGRLNCFNKDAPNPNYDPTEVLPVQSLPVSANFTFDPSSCQRTVVTPYRARTNRRRKQKQPPSSQTVNIHFPLGRPSPVNAESLCRNQNLRPLYNIRCLPAVGHEMLARQAKTVNRLERGFKKCCKKNKSLLHCADHKWRDEVDKFCAAEKGEQVDFQCCSTEAGEERYKCFQSMSPDPYYNMTSANDRISLNNICETHKIIKKKFPVGFPLKGFISKCCPLSEEDKTTCFMHKIVEMSKTLCSSKRGPLPALRICCGLPSHEAPHCISTHLMDAVTKAVNVSRQKMRKRCPLS